jgi:hypothetical protein
MATGLQLKLIADSIKRFGFTNPILVTGDFEVVAGHGRLQAAKSFLRTALWMREAPPEADLCWCELAIVAKALVDGQDVTEIGLMRDIALRTIAVLRDAGRM